MAYLKKYNDYFTLACTNIYWASAMLSLVLGAQATSHKLYKKKNPWSCGVYILDVTLLNKLSMGNPKIATYFWNMKTCIPVRHIFVYTDNARCAFKASLGPLHANEKSLEFF